MLAGEQFGRYEIRGKIGEGGMGEVYSATDLELDRDVAIKLLPNEFTVDEDRRAIPFVEHIPGCDLRGRDRFEALDGPASFRQGAVRARFDFFRGENRNGGPLGPGDDCGHTDSALEQNLYKTSSGSE